MEENLDNLQIRAYLAGELKDGDLLTFEERLRAGPALLAEVNSL